MSYKIIKTLAMSIQDSKNNRTPHNHLGDSEGLSIHLSGMTSSHPYESSVLVRNVAVFLFLLATTGYAFAIDGNYTIGGKSKKSTFATVKKDLKVSMGSGYTFHQNRNLPVPKAQKGVFNNVISYQKGNVTYYMPYKSKPVLGKFKTPAAPQVR